LGYDAGVLELKTTSGMAGTENRITSLNVEMIRSTPAQIVCNKDLAKTGWDGLLLSRFKRVLPYELMSVLAYEPLHIFNIDANLRFPPIFNLCHT
jgi:hypothetical protein